MVTKRKIYIGVVLFLVDMVLDLTGQEANQAPKYSIIPKILATAALAAGLIWGADKLRKEYRLAEIASQSTLAKVVDVNGDHIDDVVLTDKQGWPDTWYLSTPQGTFEKGELKMITTSISGKDGWRGGFVLVTDRGNVYEFVHGKHKYISADSQIKPARPEWRRARVVRPHRR